MGSAPQLLHFNFYYNYTKTIHSASLISFSSQHIECPRLWEAPRVILTLTQPLTCCKPAMLPTVRAPSAGGLGSGAKLQHVVQSRRASLLVARAELVARGKAVPPGFLEVGKVLGEGSFGQVFEVSKGSRFSSWQVSGHPRTGT